MENAV